MSSGNECLDVIGQLFRTYNKLHRVLFAELDRDNLTPSQMEVLGCLHKKPGLTQQELAEYLVVTKGNVTGLIDRLAERELVERRPVADDRRINQLFLTDQANSLFEQILPQAELVAERILSALTTEERDAMKATLTKIEHAL